MLSDDQFRRFGTEGYLVLEQVVPEELLVAADAEVDAVVAAEPPPAGAVGPHFYFLPVERLPAADAALRQSPALGLAEALVAPHRLGHGVDHIQVALNIPPYRHRPGGPHIDGHAPDLGRPDSFTMLAGVFLGDESAPNTGNLWVWPGSHIRLQQLFRERGTGALLPVRGSVPGLVPPVELPQPTPVFGRRGDLLLAHFLLGHNIGGNVGDRVRRILYYRLGCDGHRDRWEETFRDAFREYEPVRRRMTAPGPGPDH